MKKLICYFVLISSFLCGVGGASSGRKNGTTKQPIVEPRVFAQEMFKRGASNFDFRSQKVVIGTKKIIQDTYGNDKTLQVQAINAWAQNIKKITINGKTKYTDQDVYNFVNACKVELGLK